LAKVSNQLKGENSANQVTLTTAIFELDLQTGGTIL
jgi:hypothetical protein